MTLSAAQCEYDELMVLDYFAKRLFPSWSFKERVAAMQDGDILLAMIEEDELGVQIGVWSKWTGLYLESEL